MHMYIIIYATLHLLVLTVSHISYDVYYTRLLGIVVYKVDYAVYIYVYMGW